MTHKLCHYLASTFLNHIDYMFAHRDAAFMSTKSTCDTTNREVLLACREALQPLIDPQGELVTDNLMLQWAQPFKRIDYETQDLTSATKVFTARLLDLFYQTSESRAAFIKEIETFNYESHHLDLTEAIQLSSIILETLRQLSQRYTDCSWDFILEQSSIYNQTVIRYFEGLLKDASQELQELNTQLEKKVELKSQEVLQHLYYDKLTGSLNVNAFSETVLAMDEVSLILLNIDGFRKINSIFGHHFADEVLKVMCKRIEVLLEPMPEYGFYRYYGDWFIILRKDETQNYSCLESIYQKVSQLFSDEDLIIDGEHLSLTFTAGIASSNDDAIKLAEYAYQKALEERCTYAVYSDEMDIVEEYKKHAFALRMIKHAIKYETVFPYFQLIRDNKNPQNKKYECLMRIEDPYGNLFSPYIFLDVAKDAKLYSALSRIMLRKSIQHFQHLDAAFSVNLEVEDVLNTSSMDYLYDLIQEYQVQNKIILEITESENIEDFNDVGKVFARFKQIGVKVAIDDFGTGYSNFSYLTEFDFDFIKIDGSLIKNIHTDKNAYIIAKMIVDFAKKLDKQVIAEFIDKPEVQEVIERLGIDYSQGYLFSKPSPKTQ